jgi:hypothetical protein
MKAYFGVHCTANDQEPTAKDPHPVDMYQHTGSGKIINYEIKREGRSRQTGNVFLELNGLSAAHTCGAQRLFMWIDYSQNYIDVDLGDLITWLQTQSAYYKGYSKFRYHIIRPETVETAPESSGRSVTVIAPRKVFKAMFNEIINSGMSKAEFDALIAELRDSVTFE